MIGSLNNMVNILLHNKWVPLYINKTNQGIRLSIDLLQIILQHSKINKISILHSMSQIAVKCLKINCKTALMNKISNIIINIIIISSNNTKTLINKIQN